MRKVKIYGTLGPACNSEEALREMFRNGMTGIRINLSHTTLDNERAMIARIKSVAGEFGIIPDILMDMQGPELRIGAFTQPQEIKEGAIYSADELRLPKAVRPYLCGGQEVLLDDGKIMLKAYSEAKLEAVRGGSLKSKKSVALPGISVNTPALTAADIMNISIAGELDITGIMQPFVRSRRDLEDVKAALVNAGCGNIRIFAKIENLDGVRNIGELITACDEVVIARGDLGNAMHLWELPAVQKKLSADCIKTGRDFMVVTQMLASMENSPVPTRAEVSDIFNAVLDGAASVMVTGETAAGKYPGEVIRYLANVVGETLRYEEENK